MPHLHNPAGALLLAQILVSAFLAILFLQSAFDKILDREGNLGWLEGHFAKSPLAGFVPVLLSMITVFELAAGVLAAAGGAMLILRHSSVIAFYGAVVSAVSIVALFFGQRMAKEYAGAGTLVPYFILTVGAIFLLAAG
ncbi:MAG: DoxX family protein [Chthoniobacterales bacterium]|nr:DoxX family protein [Chthoniobacterales bacterium]